MQIPSKIECLFAVPSAWLFFSAYAPTLIHWPSRCSVSRFQMVVQAASPAGKPDAAVWTDDWLIPLQTLAVTRPGSLLLRPLCALTFTTEQRIQPRLGKGMMRGRFLAQLGADYGTSWSFHWLGTVGCRFSQIWKLRRQWREGLEGNVYHPKLLQ